MLNVSCVSISAIYSFASLCLYLLTTNLIVMRFYSFVNMAILLMILLKSLGTAACCFSNERLNKGFKSGTSPSTTSVLTTTTLFYDAELQSYTLTMFLIMLTLSLL